MPSITAHQSANTTKLILLGDSGTGKTGALASLAAAGYKLRILDLDNGLDILKNYLTDPSSPYVKDNKFAPLYGENVRFRTITDQMRNVNGKIIPAKVSVWATTMQMLHHWKIITPQPQINGQAVIPPLVEDLGMLTDWGTDTVLVIDSLSMLSTAAHYHHLATNGQLAANRTSNEGRRDIGAAQNLLRNFLELIFDASVKCNVILNAHISLVSETGLNPQMAKEENESVKGYPAAIGRALSPIIPRYFNTMLSTDIIGSGPGARHIISTRSRGTTGAKSTAPLKVKSEYPLGTGLADYFAAVRG